MLVLIHMVGARSQLYIYVYIYICIIATTRRHLRDYWETFDYWETCFTSPGSFAPYLIIVAIFFKYWHTHV